MKKSSGRMERIGERIREELADIIVKGLKDPRIGFVSVMSVKVTSDLRYANAYVSLYGDEKQRKGSLIGLQNAAGWIRRELGSRIRIRYTPEIRFFEDTTLDRVFRLEEVFRHIHEEEATETETDDGES